jgi:hypothetical protein
MFKSHMKQRMRAEILLIVKGRFSRFFLNVAAFYDTIQTYHLGFLTATVSC